MESFLLSTACHFLVLSAKIVWRPFLNAAINQKISSPDLVGGVATRLFIISGQPTSPDALLNHDLEISAYHLLQRLNRICVPNPVVSFQSPETIYQRIASVLEHCASNTSVSLFESSVVDFSRGAANGHTEGLTIETFISECEEFMKSLGSSEMVEPLVNQQYGKDDTPDLADFPPHVNQNLFKALRLHAQCPSRTHTSRRTSESTQINAWHPTRLSLSGPSYAINHSARFDIIASHDERSWQDCYISIPTRAETKRGRPSFASARRVELSEASSSPHHLGYLCPVLEEPRKFIIGFCLDKEMNLRVLEDNEGLSKIRPPDGGFPLSEVLKRFTLTTENKFQLAHIVSMAWWRYYSSPFMCYRWTSKDIWLMADLPYGQKEPVPFNAYLPISFYSPQNPDPEHLKGPLAGHRYPRILALGIILLEIGLGYPFTTDRETIPADEIWHWAMMSLIKLKSQSWDNFGNKKVFDQAVEDCLKYKTFDSNSCVSLDLERNSGFVTSVNQEPSSIATRRERLHRHVVAPLATVAKVVVDSLGPKATDTILLSEHVDYLINETPDENASSFLTGPKLPAVKWLQGLKEINLEISNLHKLIRSIPRVKIAILDTGIDLGMEFFRQEMRRKRVKRCRDFTLANSDSAAISDTYGHGSLMARLVMEIAPHANIFVARVAIDSKTLKSCVSNVAKAITWAGIEEKVDIISMSFGMDHPEVQISTAIAAVNAFRNYHCIFFASAGNDGPSQSKEAFPACQNDVISVFATNAKGMFLDSNPPLGDDSNIIGTFGDDLPQHILDDFNNRPSPKTPTSIDICQPGTSIATASAAGIASIILSYQSVIPSIIFKTPPYESLRAMHTTHGMRHVLDCTAATLGPQHVKFVDLISFWRLHKWCSDKHEARFAAIRTAIPPSLG